MPTWRDVYRGGRRYLLPMIAGFAMLYGLLSMLFG
jgi:hypothetical protein